MNRRDKSLFLMVMFFGGFSIWQWFSPLSSPKPMPSDPLDVSLDQDLEEEVDEEEEAPDMLIVDVKGAVESPGVYHLTAEGDLRVADAIEEAGGFTEEANTLAINRAQKLQDEAVIFVPVKGEETESAWDVSGGGSDKVSINRASQSELEQINGIGPSKAQAIIDYRQKNGAFKQLEDLLNVSGIGEKSFEQMKDHIRL